jgi:hypothetical protein
MMIAVIKRRYSEDMRWIFEIPIGSWTIERYEDADLTVQCYAVLKGTEFSEVQNGEILSHEGLIFENENDFSAWLEQYGGQYSPF